MLDVPDDWGLAEKVAIVTGGGAAGDGIGNGRPPPSCSPGPVRGSSSSIASRRWRAARWP